MPDEEVESIQKLEPPPISLSLVTTDCERYDCSEQTENDKEDEDNDADGSCELGAGSDRGLRSFLNMVIWGNIVLMVRRLINNFDLLVLERGSRGPSTVTFMALA